MKFSIMYSDFPWTFPKRKNNKSKFGQGVHGHYPVMKIEELKAVPWGDLAADNCAWFYWATTSRTDDSDLIDKLQIPKDHGFRLVNIGYNWVKLNKVSKTPFFGPGRYTKSSSELCFLYIKGKMEVKSNRVHSLVMHEMGEHSQKPSIIKDKIVELFGDLPRIEIFSRMSTEGWHSIGDEISGNSIQVDIEKMSKL
jgi:N6-adenosine-specific RNA methylase IME4